MRIALLAIAFATAAAGQSPTTTTLQDPPDGATIALLVRLGVNDAAETRWDGSVRVENGELLGLVGYELRVGDLVHPPKRWVASSRKGFFAAPRAHYEEHFTAPVGPTVLGPSIYLYLAGNEQSRVAIATAQGDFSFRVGEVATLETREMLDGRASVERTVIPTLLGRAGKHDDSVRQMDNDYPAVTVSRADGSIWASWQGYGGRGDRVYAGRLGRDAMVVAGGERDVYRTAIAVDGEGKVWVVWAEQIKANWDLYGRAYDGESWGRIERLTTASQPDTQHRLETGPDGVLHLVWQGYRGGAAQIFYRRYDAENGWGAAERVSSEGAGNCWEPALALGADGSLHVGWDEYGRMGYDIRMRSKVGARWGEVVDVATTPRFEAHVSMAADGQGRVWLAWDEAGVNWGKDFGYPRDITLPGEGLYQQRHIRVAVHENGRLREPLRQLADSLAEDPKNFYELPELASDGKGTVWMFFRHRTNYELNVPPRTPSHYALWEIYATRYEGEEWSRPALLPYSTGLNDQRMRAARTMDGSVVAAWPTDRRNFRDFSTLTPDVLAARLPAQAETPPQLRDLQARNATAGTVHSDEPGDLERIRGYVYEVGDKRYQIYRGDMHRHTEFSWDGYNDGSLQDAYRYSIDAAAFDYTAITEHIWGARHEYDWWRTQKAADLYRVGTTFTPLFAYERSVKYPNGHRNIVFSYRGVEEFDIQGHEEGEFGELKQGAEQLYAYLRRYNGIAMSHTSATGMGTDWRDWDPEVEPLVEIYQADRNSYEGAGAWRSADPHDARTQHGGYQPEGMVSRAWSLGYRLGVQASSDHMATHTSYAMILAEQNTREGLLEAIRARHAYAATDNVVLDFRLTDGKREFLMGDVARISGVPRFRVRVEGTAAIGELELVRNNRVVLSQRPNERVVELEFADNDPVEQGESFYYLRVRQTDQDRQIAWSSPIWVTR